MQRLVNAIVSTFHNNSTLSAFQGLINNASGPYYGLAPENTPFPYVTFTTVPGLANWQGFGANYGARAQIQFTVVGPDLDTVGTNTEALCNVFDGLGSLTLAGGEICRKPLRIEEPRFLTLGIDGKGRRIYSGIAQYRFVVQRVRGDGQSQYSESLTIDNSMGTGTLTAGTQMAVQLNAANAPGVFARALTDGTDLRITTATGGVVPFYLPAADYSATNQVATLHFVLQSNILPGDTGTYLVSSGNPSSSTASSFDSVFAIPAATSSTRDLWNVAGVAPIVNASGAAQAFTLVGHNTPTFGAGVGPWGYSLGGEVPATAASCVLNGTNQYLTASGAVFGSTVSASGRVKIRAKFIGTPAGNGRLFSIYCTDGNDAVYNGLDLFLDATSKQIRLSKNNGSGTTSLRAMCVPQAGESHHIVVQWGVGGLELWVDGWLQDYNADTTAWTAGSRNPFTVGAINADGGVSLFLAMAVECVEIGDSKWTRNEIMADFQYRKPIAGQVTSYDTINVRGTTIAPTQAWENSDIAEPRIQLAGINATGYPSILYSAGWDASAFGRADWNGSSYVKIAGPLLGGGGSGYPSYAGTAQHGGVARTAAGKYFVIYSNSAATGDFVMQTSDDEVSFAAPIPFLSKTQGGFDNAGNIAAVWNADANKWYILVESQRNGSWRVQAYSASADTHGVPDPATLTILNSGNPLTSLNWRLGPAYSVCPVHLVNGQYTMIQHVVPPGNYAYASGAAISTGLPSILVVARSGDFIHWQYDPYGPAATFYQGQDVSGQDQIADADIHQFGTATLVAFDAVANGSASGNLYIKSNAGATVVGVLDGVPAVRGNP